MNECMIGSSYVIVFILRIVPCTYLYTKRQTPWQTSCWAEKTSKFWLHKIRYVYDMVYQAMLQDFSWYCMSYDYLLDAYCTHSNR